MDIGSKIKKLRNEQNLTQKQLAEKSNISRSYLGDVEKNRYNASVETLSSIARALNVPVSILIDDKLDTYDKNYNKDGKALLKESKDVIYGVNNSALTPVIPSEFTNPDEARKFISMYKIFASEGFDVNKMSEEDVLDFANQILKQAELIGYKYKK